MKIRTKMLLSLSVTLVLLLTLSFSILVALASKEITKTLTSEITTQRENITKQVSDLITNSARSYLSAIGEESNSIADTYYKLYINDEITKERAEKLLQDSLINFIFLKSGTIFITDNQGIIISHPQENLIRTISPMQAWIQRLKKDEKGFKAYEYQGKNKLVYRIYNSSFDFNICVSANTSDFLQTVDLKELNKTMNNIVIGKTGYPYLLNKSGQIVTDKDTFRINTNILVETDVLGSRVYDPVLNSENGFFRFKKTGKNGEIIEKFVSHEVEPNSELIVCLTGDVNEMYGVVGKMKNVIIILGLVVLLILMVFVLIILSTVTTPLSIFTKSLADVTHGEGDLTKKIDLASSDEIGVMVKHFNEFLETLRGMVVDIKNTSGSLLNLKSEVVYGVDNTFATLKKISSNITSIKNQSSQLDRTVELSYLSSENIARNIENLNRAFIKELKIMKTTTDSVTSMIEDFTNIQALVSSARDNSIKISAKMNDEADVKMLEIITKSLEQIDSKAAVLHSNGDEVINNIQSLKYAANIVKDRSTQIQNESEGVKESLLNTKKITSYVVESLQVIIAGSQKISESMSNLKQTSARLETSGENLSSSVNRFKT